MKRYGLQLRVQPQQKKQLIKPPIPATLGFNDEEDDDYVERDIMRQAYKSKIRKDTEEQQKKALEQDPLAFDYDGVYDQMKEKQVLVANQKRVDRQPRYIQGLIDKSKRRAMDAEIIYERKLAKERSKDEHLYVDKDKYFTSAYKKKLAEQAKWIEEERLREMREAKDDVTKKTDLTDFYKNVAFGADSSKKPKKQAEEVAAQPPKQVSPPPTVTSPETSRTVKWDRDEIPENIPPKEKSDRLSETNPQDKVTKDEPSSSNQVTPGDQKRSEDAVVEAKNHHKRSEDAVAAATERYLLRKRSKLESINETQQQSLVV
ncbi:hypothetical protein ABFS83_04G215000 [Erythranthe nasuta]